MTVFSVPQKKRINTKPTKHKRMMMPLLAPAKGEKREKRKKEKQQDSWISIESESL